MKMNATVKMVIWYLVLFAVLVFVGLTALGYFYPSLQEWAREREEKRFIAETEKVAKEIEEAYANDKDGGETPEETVDLFLTALAGNDTTTASSYYELSVQPKALANLEKELKEEGNLSRSLAFYTEIKEKGEKKCNEKGDGCSIIFEYTLLEDQFIDVEGTDEKIFFPSGTNKTRSVSLSLNNESYVWKITQPY